MRELGYKQVTLNSRSRGLNKGSMLHHPASRTKGYGTQETLSRIIHESHFRHTVIKIGSFEHGIAADLTIVEISFRQFSIACRNWIAA